MNAPKKIWWSEGSQLATKVEIGSVVPYIRADIVDELVQALKVFVPDEDYVFDSDRQRADRARAALKKLEESHE